MNCPYPSLSNECSRMGVEPFDLAGSTLLRIVFGPIAWLFGARNIDADNDAVDRTCPP